MGKRVGATINNPILHGHTFLPSEEGSLLQEDNEEYLEGFKPEHFPNIPWELYRR